MSRSQRRAHIQRLKKLRAKYWGFNRKLAPKFLSMCVTTAAICSCAMCGNPRKYFKEMTVQERRANQKLGDE